MSQHSNSKEETSQDTKKTAGPDVYNIVENALQQVWAVANSLSHIKAPPHEHFRVTIFGSARIKPGQELYNEAKKLSSALASMRCDIVTGGGPGLMQAANEGAEEGDPNHEVESIGIRVALPFEQNANPFVEELYTHETFFTRLHHFVRLSDAFVIMNGGIGTTLETLMIWQLLQVKHLENVPLIFMGEMWSELKAWSKKYMLPHEPSLANPADLDIPQCVANTDEAIEVLKPYIEAHNERFRSMNTGTAHEGE
ncbi:MAG: LOG family protein [Deltaproteobacteria bacterium]|nr:MAG: LOG family protein [Deltaproteobacteria bacterium]